MLNLLITIILLGSLTVWFLFLTKPSKFPLLQFNPRIPFPRCYLAILVTLLLISITFVTQFSPEHENLRLDLKTVASSNLQNALLLILLLGLIKVTPRRIARLEDYGISEDKPAIQLRDGLLGFLLAVIPVALFRMLTFPFLTEEGTHPLIKLVNGSSDYALWAHVLFAAVVLAPMLEELMYRVILQGWLKTVLTRHAAIWLAAIIFSAIHGMPNAIALLPLALVLGYVYDIRHRYFTTVVIHMLFNLTNLVMLFLAPEELVAPPAQ